MEDLEMEHFLRLGIPAVSRPQLGTDFGTMLSKAENGENPEQKI